MKIFQLLTELEPGGAEQVVLDLSSELVRRGHEVVLGVLRTPPENPVLEQAFRELNVPVFFFGLRSWKDLPAALFRLRKQVKAFSPDVLHSHLIHPNLLSRAAFPFRFFRQMRLINTVHISERRDGQQLFFLADTLTVPFCDVCTAVSASTARFQERKIHLKEHSIRCVWNGMDLLPVLAEEERRQIRDAWGMGACSRILGCVGRLDRQKGFDRLIRILPELGKHVPAGERWGVVILGEGRERAVLESLIRTTALPPGILLRLPGFDPEAGRHTDAFDAFAMPSRYEGFGLVLARAQSFGLPVVVEKIDSLPELCSGYPAAFPVSFSDPAPAARALAEALNMPRTTPRILQSCSQMAEEYLKLYQTE